MSPRRPESRTRSRAWRCARLAGVALAAWGLATAAAAQTTFIVFHSPQDDGQALGAKPSPPPAAVNVGGSLVLHLYLENWRSGGPIASGGGVCVNGTGSEVCGWLLELTAEGLRIDGFGDAQGGEGGIVAMLGPNGESLKVAGGSPGGELGPVAVGDLQLRVLSPNASLELTGGSWVDAAGVLRQPSVQVLAVSIDTCGNARLEVPEECDDGNASAGDGCFPTCRVEDGFTLSGTARGGRIELGLAEKTGLLVVTTIAGETADVIAARLARLIDEDPEVSAAARSAEAIAGPGVVMDATLVSATSQDPGLQLTLLPEPSGTLMLGAGLALLSGLAPRRGRGPGRPDRQGGRRRRMVSLPNFDRIA